ncbi:MAG TPA: BrnT family toxin [Acidobacteriaceae bacterium]
MNPLEACIGFDWDEANTSKNWDKHRVSPEEAESIFFHDPLTLMSDHAHSLQEARFQALGETPVGRRLLVVFTVRRKLIRVISARNMNRRESEAYAKHEKANS